MLRSAFLNFRDAFTIFGLLANPLILSLGLGYIALAFAPQASLVEVIVFPVSGLVMILLALSSLLVLPRILNRFWFLAASMFHLYLGIDGFMSENVLIVFVGVLCLLYSFAEFSIFRRPIPSAPVLPPESSPPDPS